MITPEHIVASAVAELRDELGRLKRGEPDSTLHKWATFDEMCSDLPADDGRQVNLQLWCQAVALSDGRRASDLTDLVDYNDDDTMIHAVFTLATIDTQPDSVGLAFTELETALSGRVRDEDGFDQFDDDIVGTLRHILYSVVGRMILTPA